MHSTASLHTICAFETIICLEGFPKCIVLDNGLQFVSVEYRRFCSTNGIKYMTSAPFSPQCNGKSDCFVRNFKTQMMKLHSEHSDEESLLIFLHSYCCMPVPDKFLVELLHGRAYSMLLNFLSSHSVPTTPLFHTNFAINDLVFFRVYNQTSLGEPGQLEV